MAAKPQRSASIKEPKLMKIESYLCEFDTEGSEYPYKYSAATGIKVWEILEGKYPSKA